jgi:hypothetical protein
MGGKDSGIGFGSSPRKLKNNVKTSGQRLLMFLFI